MLLFLESRLQKSGAILMSVERISPAVFGMNRVSAIESLTSSSVRDFFAYSLLYIAVQGTSCLRGVYPSIQPTSGAILCTIDETRSQLTATVRARLYRNPVPDIALLQSQCMSFSFAKKQLSISALRRQSMEPHDAAHYLQHYQHSYHSWIIQLPTASLIAFGVGFG